MPRWAGLAKVQPAGPGQGSCPLADPQGAHLVCGFGDKAGTDPLEGSSWGLLGYRAAAAHSMRGEAKTFPLLRKALN